MLQTNPMNFLKEWGLARRFLNDGCVTALPDDRYRVKDGDANYSGDLSTCSCGKPNCVHRKAFFLYADAVQSALESVEQILNCALDKRVE